ncbi:MAG: insulinase family protein, partial [Candidatus Magasanikbacteria bacterium]|nr:insulinase family protein [Candidatus Magasanikbacteria bacterium]
SKVKVSAHYKPAIFGSTKKSDRIVVEHKKTDQVQMMLGWPGFKHGAKENTVLRVLNTILGGSMSSRLFIQVRERKGLAYVVRSGASAYRDIGYAYVQAGLEPKNINKAIVCIQDEIKKLVQKGVTARELADAKTHYRGRITLSLEDSSNQAEWYAKNALFQEKILSPEERLKEIESVTAKQVQDLAKKIFKSEQMRVAIIGDVTADSIKF